MPDIHIKNTRIYYNNSLQPAEIIIENDKIKKIGKDFRVSSVDMVIDAGGALTLPAGIDVHVHFREPGMTLKENWYTGSCSAAAGGIATVIDQPNTIPPTTDRRSFEQKLKFARGKSIVDFGINGGVTENIEKLKELWRLGVMAFGEIFMAESTGGLNINEETFEEALAEIKRLGALATIHAEDEKMRLELEQLLKGDVSFDYHSKVRPNACEASAVKSALELISRLEVRAHFCHLSTLEAVGMIRKEKYLAKRENKSPLFTCEVTPHHLFLSTRDWERLRAFGKMNPPLRSSHSIKALVNGLNDGTIDMVASDHAPHLESEKDADIRAAPSGVPGVETLMPLMLAAVRKNILPLSQMIMVTSRNPAKAFGLDRLGKGRLEVGFDADLMIVDPRNLQPIRADMLHSKAGWTPFEGMDAVFPEYTLSRGEVIWMEESINARPGRGKFLEGSGKRSKEDEEEDYEETGSE
ncbi:Dihydroorotase [Methanosarcina horonobensis HB-1 = JCM 15518]|uniref:Dihydroorotase n=1 Tax=Methanosarcina horonobensis HB-1 = JCM 15518 TaxID=1434110 RepID=A0A0E3WUT8_9EURY|nr:dihydroorotase [Methanosarcina horonobensis]AKB79820.1 Dihydroorotase [Methanosarcina horonobensis HB-1 = JCM 15518]